MGDAVNLVEEHGFEVFISSDFKDEGWQVGACFCWCEIRKIFQLYMIY